MAVYDVDRLMLEARKLAAEYRRATGKPLGISGEIALHDVMRILQLTLPDQSQSGVDAIGTGEREGKRIQIKGRTVGSGDSKSTQRIGQIKIEQEWDLVMMLLMDDDYEPLEIYQAERDAIVEAVKKSSSKRRNRGALSVAKFKNISTLVWSKS